MSCPVPINPNQCETRQCTDRERLVNELKCNIPICNGQDLCIPVYYTPSDLQASVSTKRIRGRCFIFLLFRKFSLIRK